MKWYVRIITFFGSIIESVCCGRTADEAGMNARRNYPRSVVAETKELK
jgi:hypothetical protein